MTTKEFTERLESANTLCDLRILRYEVSAPIFISEIKDKINKVAIKEGYIRADKSISFLKGYTSRTDCGQFTENVKIGKSNFFSSNSIIDIYVNEKYARGNKVTFFYKYND